MNPSTPSPLAASARLANRPTPPGRTKRHSLTPTSRANISRSIDAVKANAGAAAGGVGGGGGGGKRDSIGAGQAPGSPLPSPRGAVMQGVRDRNEEDVSRAGRMELERALREEWEAKDRLLARIDTLTTDQDRLEHERKELVQSLGGLQSRVDEAFSEQGRLEQDVESRDQLLERMRVKGQETDKALREAQRRYTEQEKSFEAERDAYRAQEAHLQSRIHTLTRSSTLTSRSTSPTDPSVPLPAAGLAEQFETLNEELASLSAAHCSLIAQYNTTSKEVADLKGENKRLEEENAGWELLMRDQTMSGNVKGRGMFSEDWLDEGELSEEEGGVGTDSGGLRVGEVAEKSKMKKQQRPKGRTVLESLDEEMEMGLEEGREGDTEGMQSLGSGGDLAAELGRVNEDLVQPAVVKPSEADNLRAEIKSLKDANKALSLYCSKIIDRIIAQEGFEHVLSVDYKTRRGKASTSNAPSTGATSGMGTSGKPRGSVQDLVHNMHAQSTDPATDQNGGDDFLQTHSRARPASAATATAPSLAAFEIGGAVPTPVVTPPTPAKEPRKARPLSLMVRGWSYAGDSANTAATTKTTEQGKERDVPSRHASVSPEKAQPNDEEVKAEKRAKRGFSIDFRSFGFGSGSSSASSSAPAEPKGLKPLTLPRRQASGTYTASNGSASGERSRATSPIAPSPLEASGSVLGQARKLPQMEEDEEDKRERHRMEAAMRLMGINRGVSFNGGPASPIGRGDYDTSNNQAHVLSSPVGLSLNSNPDSPVFPSDDRLPSPDKDRTRAPLTGTPLSRLHTALTSTSNSRTSSPMLELADPLSPVTDRAAEEALRAFDGGEAEQAKMLAQGRAMTEFTTPRKVGEGRRRMSGRRGPSAYGQGSEGASPDKGMRTGAGMAPKARTMSKSESISTLFSAGTDSPSGSVDLGRGNKPDQAE